MSFAAASARSGVMRLAAPRSSPAPHSEGHHLGPMGVSGPSGFFSFGFASKARGLAGASPSRAGEPGSIASPRDNRTTARRDVMSGTSQEKGGCAKTSPAESLHGHGRLVQRRRSRRNAASEGMTMRPPVNCPGPAGLTRRNMLQIGSIGALNLALPQVLAARERASRNGGGPRADSCILVFLNGGPSHLDTWDMKP